MIMKHSKPIISFIGLDLDTRYHSNVSNLLYERLYEKVNFELAYILNNDNKLERIKECVIYYGASQDLDSSTKYHIDAINKRPKESLLIVRVKINAKLIEQVDGYFFNDRKFDYIKKKGAHQAIDPVVFSEIMFNIINHLFTISNYEVELTKFKQEITLNKNQYLSYPDMCEHMFFLLRDKEKSFIKSLKDQNLAKKWEELINKYCQEYHELFNPHVLPESQ